MRCRASRYGSSLHPGILQLAVTSGRAGAETSRAIQMVGYHSPPFTMLAGEVVKFASIQVLAVLDCRRSLRGVHSCDSRGGLGRLPRRSVRDALRRSGLALRRSGWSSSCLTGQLRPHRLQPHATVTDRAFIVSSRRTEPTAPQRPHRSGTRKQTPCSEARSPCSMAGRIFVAFIWCSGRISNGAAGGSCKKRDRTETPPFNELRSVRPQNVGCDQTLSAV